MTFIVMSKYSGHSYEGILVAHVRISFGILAYCGMFMVCVLKAFSSPVIGQSPSYLKELVAHYYSARSLLSLDTGLLVGLRASKSEIGVFS